MTIQSKNRCDIGLALLSLAPGQSARIGRVRGPRFFVLLCVGAFCVLATNLFAQQRLPEMTVEDIARLSQIIKPGPNECTWRKIDWLTNVTEARELAAKEGKPMIIFTAADGSPLGRT